MPDFLTKAERSARMARIRGTNTTPERLVFRFLRRTGVYFARHARDLPGSPDIVFRQARLAVFIDGDFWHGRNFSAWRDGLAPYWAEKIERNARRDRRQSRLLRSLGWHVLRVWGTDACRSPEKAAKRIVDARRSLLATPQRYEP